MAGFGESRVPHDILSDEDKWFKFFTKVQLLGIAVFAFIGFIFFKGLSLLGFTMAGIGCLIICTGIGALLMMVRMPNSRYLTGGGSYIWEIITILIYRKAVKCIYVRNYESLEELEEKEKR